MAVYVRRSWVFDVEEPRPNAQIGNREGQQLWEKCYEETLIVVSLETGP